jgi:hypothetical protein
VKYLSDASLSRLQDRCKHLSSSCRRSVLSRKTETLIKTGEAGVDPTWVARFLSTVRGSTRLRGRPSLIRRSCGRYLSLAVRTLLGRCRGWRHEHCPPKGPSTARSLIRQSNRACRSVGSAFTRRKQTSRKQGQPAQALGLREGIRLTRAYALDAVVYRADSRQPQPRRGHQRLRHGMPLMSVIEPASSRVQAFFVFGSPARHVVDSAHGAIREGPI